DSAVFLHNRLEYHRPLISSLPRFLGVLRINLFDDGGRADTSADSENAAAVAAAFTRADSRTAPRANAPSVSSSDTTARPRAGGRRTRNAFRIADVQEI